MTPGVHDYVYKMRRKIVDMTHNRGVDLQLNKKEDPIFLCLCFSVDACSELMCTK